MLKCDKHIKLTYSFCHKLKGRSHRYFSCNDAAHELRKFVKLGKTWFHSPTESLIFGRTLNSDYLSILPLQLPKGSSARIQTPFNPNRLNLKVLKNLNADQIQDVLSPFHNILTLRFSWHRDCSFHPDTAERDFTPLFTPAPFLRQHFRFSVSTLWNFIQCFTFISSSRTPQF